MMRVFFEINDAVRRVDYLLRHQSSLPWVWATRSEIGRLGRARILEVAKAERLFCYETLEEILG